MSPWQELGIQPTTNTDAIRRAYAARLKQTRPEEDPEAFQRLRVAYESVLTQVTHPAAPTGQPMHPPREAPAPQVFPGEMQHGAEPAQAPTTSRNVTTWNDDLGEEEAQRAILQALARGDGDTASRALDDAITGGKLSLSAQIALSDRLLAVLVTDQSISYTRLLEIATRHGWYGVIGRLEGSDEQLAQQLCARIDAEIWFDRLQRLARRPTFYIGEHGSGAARLLLGNGPILLSRVLPPQPYLTSLLAQLHLHLPWLEQRFDPARLEKLHKLSVRRDTFYVRYCAIFALCVLLSAMTGIRLYVFLLPAYALSRFRRYSRTTIALCFASALVAGLASMLLVFNGKHPWPLVTQQWPLITQNTTAPTNPPAPSGFAETMLRAQRGEAMAQTRLGFAFMKGEGVAKNEAKAAMWFRRAMDRDPRSAAVLGYLYERGKGVLRDLVKARRLYQSAAERGDVVGEVDLALAYAFGYGGAVNRERAFHWYKEAAKQGDPIAMNGIGYSYLNGYGVARDVKSAFTWLKRAAEAGQPNAMHSLGAMYLSGVGTDPDMQKAYFWLGLAVRAYPQDEPHLGAAKSELSRIGGFLTEAKRARVTRELEDWKPRAAKPPTLVQRRGINKVGKTSYPDSLRDAGS